MYIFIIFQAQIAITSNKKQASVRIIFTN